MNQSILSACKCSPAQNIICYELKAGISKVQKYSCVSTRIFSSSYFEIGLVFCFYTYLSSLLTKMSGDWAYQPDQGEIFNNILLRISVYSSEVRGRWNEHIALQGCFQRWPNLTFHLKSGDCYMIYLRNKTYGKSICSDCIHGMNIFYSDENPWEESYVVLKGVHGAAHPLHVFMCRGSFGCELDSMGEAQRHQYTLSFPESCLSLLKAYL